MGGTPARPGRVALMCLLQPAPQLQGTTAHLGQNGHVAHCLWYAGRLSWLWARHAGEADVVLLHGQACAW